MTKVRFHAIDGEATENESGSEEQEHETKNKEQENDTIEDHSDDDEVTSECESVSTIGYTRTEERDELDNPENPENENENNEVITSDAEATEVNREILNEHRENVAKQTAT